VRVLTIGNMFPPASVGGYELVWRSAVDHLRRAGHEVRVLTSDHGAGAVGAGADVHRQLRLYWREHEFPRLSIAERLRIERANADVLDSHLAAFRPQVVNWWAMGGMSMSLLERARSAGLPAVGVVCDDWMIYGPRVDAWTRAVDRPLVGGLATRLTGIASRPRLATAAKWIFLSETLRRRAREAGVGPVDSEVVNRGPDDDLFGPVPPGEWRWRLLYIGRIDPRKGIDTAIEGLARLGRQAGLAIDGAGDERHRAELERLAGRLGVARRVRFDLSPRERVPAAYAAADAVVFPVRWNEPWGLVPLEAMAIGRPVLATGAGGSGEYLRDGHNCLLFEPGDAAGLAAAVERLAAEPELRERLRTGGFETAARFGERPFNARIEAVLEESALPQSVRRSPRGRSRARPPLRPRS
jgi:glycosyltransferase involved in cell wall biosynthesis